MFTDAAEKEAANEAGNTAGKGGQWADDYAVRGGDLCEPANVAQVRGGGFRDAPGVLRTVPLEDGPVLTAVIYSISCDKAGRVYIGSTRNFEQRRKAHIEELERGTHHCIGLQAAHDEFGMGSLSV